MHYPEPQPTILCDSDRNILRQLQDDQYYYCENCLTYHDHPEFMTPAEQANDPDAACFEHYLHLADLEDRAESRREEARYDA